MPPTGCMLGVSAYDDKQFLSGCLMDTSSSGGSSVATTEDGSQQYDHSTENGSETAPENQAADRTPLSAECHAFKTMAQNACFIGEDLPPLLDKAMGSLLEPATPADATTDCLTIGRTVIVAKIAMALLLASAAYRPLDVFKQRTGLQAVQLLQDRRTDTTCYVAWGDDSTAFVAFRGTSSMQTALIDTKFFSHRIKLMAEVFPGISVHAGFASQLNAVISLTNPEMNLGRVILKLSGGREPARLVCVGHSLGGAVAHLAALCSGRHESATTSSSRHSTSWSVQAIG